MRGAREADLPYPPAHIDSYAASKAAAERIVIAANGTPLAAIAGAAAAIVGADPSAALLTVALRPHIVFGPFDTHFLPPFLARAREGGVTHTVGGGRNTVDLTYVGNVAQALALAGRHLLLASHALDAGAGAGERVGEGQGSAEGKAEENEEEEQEQEGREDNCVAPVGAAAPRPHACASPHSSRSPATAPAPSLSAPARSPVPGSVYFVTNGEPVQLWPFLADVLSEFGLTAPDRHISFAVAYAFSAFLHGLSALLGSLAWFEPAAPRSLVCALALDAHFSQAKARAELGFAPATSLNQGIVRTLDWLKGQDWQRARRGSAAWHADRLRHPLQDEEEGEHGSDACESSGASSGIMGAATPVAKTPAAGSLPPAQSLAAATEAAAAGPSAAGVASAVPGLGARGAAMGASGGAAGAGGPTAAGLTPSGQRVPQRSASFARIDRLLASPPASASVDWAAVDEEHLLLDET